MDLLKQLWTWLTTEAGPLGVLIAALSLIVAILALVWGVRAQRRSRPERDIPDDQLKRNRLQMLSRVHSDWIEGVLDQSLYKVARLELGLETKPDAVQPLNVQVQRHDQPSKPLAAGTRLSSFFGYHQLGQLLILGAPGSGKTTLLLELAKDLIERAKQDESLQIPIVFNLSSWVLERQPLPDWLKEELNLRYDVPRKIAKVWVETEAILPLLDGLDEVSADHREACVEAINEFRTNQPLVVCSRLGSHSGMGEPPRL